MIYLCPRSRYLKRLRIRRFTVNLITVLIWVLMLANIWLDPKLLQFEFNSDAKMLRCLFNVSTRYPHLFIVEPELLKMVLTKNRSWTPPAEGPTAVFGLFASGYNETWYHGKLWKVGELTHRVMTANGDKVGHDFWRLDECNGAVLQVVWFHQVGNHEGHYYWIEPVPRNWTIESKVGT